MGEGVVPAVLVEGTIFDVAYGVLPLVTRGQVGTLHDASTGEAEDARMEVLKILDEVGAQSVPVVSGHEAHMVEINALAALKEDAHQSFLHGAV